MKIVCDTNVLISGILFGGNARQILDLATRGAVTNAISADILNEAQGVLLRPKFGLSTSQVLGILELFRDTFETVIPGCPVAAITDDPDDNRILEAALAAKADAIVSGDKHLLDLGTWNGIPILSLADFLSRLK